MAAIGSTNGYHVGSYHQFGTQASYFDQIDNLTQQTNQDSYVGSLKEITKSHWKPVENVSSCATRSCRKSFSTLLERPHHCRKCGDVFCAECTKYQRRLNNLAHFDPNGSMYKVCKACFDQDKITDGQMRNHTPVFVHLRAKIKQLGASYDSESNLPRRWSKRFNLDAECYRITSGFQQSVKDSDIWKTLHVSEFWKTMHDLKTMVVTPDWMRSSTLIQENLATRCHFCQAQFGILKKKQHCTICGIAMCKACSTKDLLVYFPDEGSGENPYQAQLSIIKFVGCPSVEPEISLYLRVCNPCKDKLVEKQIKVEQGDEEELRSPSDGFLDHLKIINDRFVKAEEKVRDQLPKYQKVVESLDDGTRQTSSQSNIKILAKAQEDLADVLANHVTVVQQLKRLKPLTATQAYLLKTYIRAKCEFYLDHMSQFRALKHKLSESIPAESLDFIQRVMDKNAIISTHLYVRQLVYETIYLCDKYNLEDDVPVFLLKVEQKIEPDVHTSLRENREDIDEHMAILKDMIKTRMKENKLIKPSTRDFQRLGVVYIVELIKTRSETILTQVNAQLQLASAIRSFPDTKSGLEAALEGLRTWRAGEKELGNEYAFL